MKEKYFRNFSIFRTFFTIVCDLHESCLKVFLLWPYFESFLAFIGWRIWLPSGLSWWLFCQYFRYFWFFFTKWDWRGVRSLWGLLWRDWSEIWARIFPCYAILLAKTSWPKNDSKSLWKTSIYSLQTSRRKMGTQIYRKSKKFSFFFYTWIFIFELTLFYFDIYQ